MNEDQHDESSESPGSPEWRVPGDEQLETDAYHVWKPRPLLRSVHWKPVPAPSREAGVGSYDVFVDQRVLKALHQHVWNAAPGEAPQGFLVGDLCEDPDTGRRYVIVSAAVPSRFPMVEEGPEQIPGEALVAMQLEVDRRRGVLAGWYHRHEAGPVELTAEDLQTHERHFPEPWQIALLLVTDHAEPSGGCFRRTRSGLAGDVPLPFFEMVSNESLLARGVRRSYMDWVNVETADSIDPDRPSRPEPLPEPPAEPEPVVEAELLVESDAAEGIDSAGTPAPEHPDSLDRGDIGPVVELEDDGASPIDLDLAMDEDFVVPQFEAGEEPEAGEDAESHDVGSLAETADSILSIEDEPSAVEREAILAEPEGAETEINLPVLDEPVSHDTEADADVDVELPEPGWDSGNGADDLSLPLVEDVDLDSFVTEVESADVAAQVDATIDLEAIEPGWDDADVDESPDVDLLPVTEFAAGLDDELEDESEEVTGEEEELDPIAAPEDETEPQPRPSRSRRTTLVVGGVLVALAIVVSLVVFVLPSGVETTDGAAAPVDDPPVQMGESALDDPPVESAAAADSATSPVSVDDVEQLGDDLLESISRYYGRAVAVDGGQATCADLQSAYVEVEDRWIAYNVQGRARFRGRLPEDLATRDERLYAGVQDVEREFTRSGCERP